MTPERPKQSVPAEIVADLMRNIRNSFYPDSFVDGDNPWFKDQHFIRRHVVTWPAAWLNGKGVTLTPERYKQIVLDVVLGIKQHGSTGAVQYWPGYLKHCLQSHFKIHGDEIYDEAKSVRVAADAVVASLQQRIGAPDPIEVIAMARQITKPARARTYKPIGRQMDLF